MRGASSSSRLRDQVAIKKQVRRSILGDSECEVHLRPSRGRCVLAKVSLSPGVVIKLLSGPPYAACLLRSNHLRCEHCFGDVQRYGTEHAQPVAASCPRGCSAVYCSDLCRGEDFRYWGHEMALTAAPGASALRAHAVKSESLGAESDPESLDRFGALLLAVRCLWRHHGSGSTQHNARPQLPSSLSSVEFNREEEEEHILFERLAHGPSVADMDDLAQLAAEVPGYLPPGVSASRVVTMIGCLRANYASFTDEVGTIIGAGCYTRQSQINHSCAPNCVLSFGPRGRVNVRTARPISAGEELVTTYIDLSMEWRLRQETLWQRYGFECDCIRCMRDGDGDAIGYRQRDEEDINALLEAAQQAQAREREMPWRLLEESAR